MLDKGELPDNDGSTSHAPGGMHVINGAETMTRMAMYSRELYSNLADYDPDAYPMVRLVGGIEVAHTKKRLEYDLKRKIGWARVYGVEAQLITPQEASELVPILNADVLHRLGASSSNFVGFGFHNPTQQMQRVVYSDKCVLTLYKIHRLFKQSIAILLLLNLTINSFVIYIQIVYRQNDLIVIK